MIQRDAYYTTEELERQGMTREEIQQMAKSKPPKSLSQYWFSGADVCTWIGNQKKVKNARIVAAKPPKRKKKVSRKNVNSTKLHD